MYDVGLHKNFDAAIGISAGAPIISYFLSGEPEMGTSIYYEDLPDNAFISFKRYLLGKGDLADIDMLCDIFAGRRGNKALNISALKENPAKAFAVATEYDTAYQDLINLKEMQDPVEGIRASIAMPEFYKGRVYINGKKFIDGAVPNACADYQLLKQFESTDILVLANRAQVMQNVAPSSNRGRLIIPLLVSLPIHLQESILRAEYATWKSVNALRASGKRVLFVWVDGLKTFDMDAKRMREGAHAFYSHMRSFIEKARKS